MLHVWGTVRNPCEKIPFPSTVIFTNLGFNQKCAISTNKVEALPFKNGSWLCCMDPYSNPRKWQPLGSPLPKYGTAANILWWWLKTESSYHSIELADNLLTAVLETQWNIIFPTQRFGMPKQPLFREGCAGCGIGVILAVFDFIDNPADNGIPHFYWSFYDVGSHRQRLLYHFTPVSYTHLTLPTKRIV